MFPEGAHSELYLEDGAGVAYRGSLAEEPEVESRVRHTLGRLFMNLGRYREAREQLEVHLRAWLKRLERDDVVRPIRTAGEPGDLELAVLIGARDQDRKASWHPARWILRKQQRHEVLDRAADFIDRAAEDFRALLREHDANVLVLAARLEGDRREHLPGASRFEGDLPAQEVVGIDVAQDHVDVGDGGLGAAGVVAERARRRSRAARPDLEGAARREGELVQVNGQVIAPGVVHAVVQDSVDRNARQAADEVGVLVLDLAPALLGAFVRLEGAQLNAIRPNGLCEFLFARLGRRGLGRLAGIAGGYDLEKRVPRDARLRLCTINGGDVVVSARPPTLDERPDLVGTGAHEIGNVRHHLPPRINLSVGAWWKGQHLFGAETRIDIGKSREAAQ